MPVNSPNKTAWENQVQTVYMLDPDTGEPTGSVTLPLETTSPCWQYMGGVAMTLDGVNDLQVNLPAGTTAFYLRARGGEVYYSINGVNCAANVPGYVPEDGADGTGKLCNLDRLWIFSETVGTVAHLQFFSGG